MKSFTISWLLFFLLLRPEGNCKLPNFQAKVVLFVGHFLLPGQKFLRQRTMQSYIYGRRRRSEKKIFMLMMTASSSRSLILLPLKIQGTLFFAIHQFVCFNNVTKNIEHEVLLWYTTYPFLKHVTYYLFRYILTVY